MRWASTNLFNDLKTATRSSMSFWMSAIYFSMRSGLVTNCAAGKKMNSLYSLMTWREPRSNSWILSLIHISEPTRLGMISYAVFCLKKKKKKKKKNTNKQKKKKTKQNKKKTKKKKTTN